MSNGVKPLVIFIALLLVLGGFLRWRSNNVQKVLKENARVAQVSVELPGIVAAVSNYIADSKSVPSSEEGFAPLIKNDSGSKEWKGPYLQQLPLDPWGRPYIYRRIQKGRTQQFEIVCVGIDGILDTADDITVYSNVAVTSRIGG